MPRIVQVLSCIMTIYDFFFYFLNDTLKSIYSFIRFIDRITFLKDSFLQIICFFCAILPKEAKVFGNPI